MLLTYILCKPFKKLFLQNIHYDNSIETKEPNKILCLEQLSIHLFDTIQHQRLNVKLSNIFP